MSDQANAPVVWNPVPGLCVVLRGTCITCQSFNRANAFCAKRQARVAESQHGCATYYSQRQPNDRELDANN